MKTSSSSAAGPVDARLSESLAAVAADDSRDRISVADVIAAVQDRAFGALIFIFALPNIIPTPPGTSAVLGTPLVLLSAQLMLGRKAPWLPKFVARRSMAQADFAAVMRHAIPWVVRAERLLKPRLGTLAHPPVEQIVGALSLLLSLILALPIPLGNIPPAISLCLFSLGLLERDGVAIILGLAMTILSVAIVSGVIVALVTSAIYVLTKAFGI